jgi:hypothetical protein
MPLQTPHLVMTGLGISGDRPPGDHQPPLADGIHLRWAFETSLGFPWHGFHLFRRPSRGGTLRCLAEYLTSVRVGAWPYPVLDTPLGRLSSDSPLSFAEFFPPGERAELHLDCRRSLRFDLPAGEPARRVEVQIGFLGPEESTRAIAVRAAAVSAGVPVAEATVRGRYGETATAVLEFDAITSVEVAAAPAVLIDLCLLPVAQDATAGWVRAPGFPEPMRLPVTHPAYPCTPGLPPDPKAAETLALSRVRYGRAADWAGAAFGELYPELFFLVRGGPRLGAMASRLRRDLRGVLDPPEPGAEQPVMPEQSPLELVLLGAIDPAWAQIVGLYWIDGEAVAGAPHDYLLIADHAGAGRGSAAQVLDHIRKNGFGGVDAWICFGLRKAPAPPLEPPRDVRVYSLPGGTLRGRDGTLRDATNNAGLRWDLGLDADGALPPGGPVMYHLWRAGLGNGETPRAPGAYEWITRGQPALVAEPVEEEPRRAADWPPFPLHALDTGLPEGWLSYKVSGVDLFGRHSRLSLAARWFQWTWPAGGETPRPWYFQDPPGDREVHPAAVRLLDKLAPPAPAGVEASMLDPDDPTVVQDAAYKAWRAALPPTQRVALVGLRVRWLWPETHQQQAPDTAEFRIYFHPGTELPAPDHARAIHWQQRIHAAGFAEALRAPAPGSPPGLREYEVFLAAPAGAALTPSRAKPVVYGYVSVSAADGRPHTADAAKWAAGKWGGRAGNEGRIGPPAKVFRVLRAPVPAPAPPPEGERVYATPADYHGRSFYTFRWRAEDGLKVHVFRALDDALFQADWSARAGRKPLDPASDKALFPAEWSAARRSAAAAQVNAVARREDYGGLGDDAIRVLAGLPGIAGAFVQVTLAPLDPNDPATIDRPGPNEPADRKADPSLRVFVDTLDGRSTNRYLYRALYVDDAHNRSPLGLARAPVWLPRVEPPRAPVITSVVGGDREITLTWTANREPDLNEYRVYRTDRDDDARDVRLMELVHTEPVTRPPAERAPESVFPDGSLPGLTNFYYRVVAVDTAGNVSEPSTVAAARTFDDARPEPPTWNPPAPGPTPGLVVLSWASPVPDLACLVERRRPGTEKWEISSDWLPRGIYMFSDGDRSPAATFEYRLRILDRDGRLNRNFLTLKV